MGILEKKTNKLLVLSMDAMVSEDLDYLKNK